MSYNSVLLGLSPTWYQPLNGTLTGTGLTEGTDTFWDGAAAFYTSSGNDNDMAVDSGGFVKFATGTTNAISILNSASIFNDKAFSIAFWFRSPTTAATTKQIFWSQNGSSRVEISLTSGGAISATLATGSATRTASANGTYGQRLDDGFWHHVVYTVAASGTSAGKIYIDSGSVGQHTANGGTLSLDGSGVPKYWAQTGSGTFRSDLWLDELTVFNSTLTQGDVSSLYAEGQKQWSYSYTQRKYGAEILYSGNATSSSNPVINSGTLGNGTTSGTYLSTSGANAFTGANGFEFDRSSYTGVTKTTLASGSLNDRQFTMGAWIKTDGATGFPTIVRIGDSGAGTNAIIWRVRGTDQGSPGVLEAYVGNVTLYSSNRVDDGNWHYVSLRVSFVDNYFRMFIDGVQRGSVSTTGMATLNLTGQALYFGTSITTPGESFVGKIDEFVINPIALNEYEIHTLPYESGLYNQNPSSIDISVTDVPMTASADAVDPATTTDSNVDYPADPILVTNSELLDPSVQAESNIDVLADPMVVTNSELVDPSIQTEINLDVVADPAIVTDAQVVLPTITVETNIDNTSGTLDASADILDPSIATDSNVDYPADPKTASATMVDSLIDTTSDVSQYWLIDEATSLFVDPTLIVDFESINNADPMLANAEGTDVNIQTESNFDHLADHFHVTNSELVDPVIFVEINISITADILTASAEMVNPTLNVEQGIDVASTALLANALIVDSTVYVEASVIVLADPMEVSDSVLVDPTIYVEVNALWNALPMLASARKTIMDRAQGNYTWNTVNLYQQKIKSIGAEIHFSKNYFATGMSWVDWRATDLNNVAFGLLNSNSGTDVSASGNIVVPAVPSSEVVPTCNETKMGGALKNTDVINFYPKSDRYGTLNPTAPTASQVVGNEDWRYDEFTGPWFYITTEDSYEMIFSTTVQNQILFSGQTTYTVPNTTTTLRDDKIINTYIEYGLVDGKLYVKFFPQINDEPITIVGNTNIADGNDHHIIMQRTPADGMFRNNYLLNARIGLYNIWSPTTAANVDRHGVTGTQITDDTFYSTPSGEIFHGFEIWIDGELDHRSTEFNTTHNAPIVKQIGGKQFMGLVQDLSGGGVKTTRNTTTGITGILTHFAARLNTEKINGLSSYFLDYADMPRFPQEAKIFKHAAVDPQTISILAQLALSDVTPVEADAATASAEMVMPTVSTNVKKILRLFWNPENTTGVSFGATTDGLEFSVDTYSVTNRLENNPSHVYNVDAANHDRMPNPELSATPNTGLRWLDQNGVPRLIDLEEDINLGNYQTILFMDYPDTSNENDSFLIGSPYVYKEQQINKLVNQIKSAVINDGVSIFVSNPTLAIKLGIISKETVISQDYQTNDTTSAALNPFTSVKAINYFDTHRNNRYQIMSQFAGITDMPSYILSDAISYATDLNDEYHLKYQLRNTGLQVGDQMIIPSLPLLPSQLNNDLAGYTNNRINNLSVIAPADLLAGTAIAKIAGTNYITTVAAGPGSLLGGVPITGRIFVNFVEDALTMGIQEYNYGTIQIGLDISTADEGTETVGWQYSTTRTNRKLSASNNIIVNKGIYGQTYPTLGGGGPIVQSPTSSTYGNIRSDYDNGNESFTSSIYYDISSEAYPTDTIFVASMTFRGLDWLNQSNKVFNVGGNATSPLASAWDEAIQLTITSLPKITLYIQEEIK